MASTRSVHALASVARALLLAAWCATLASCSAGSPRTPATATATPAGETAAGESSGSSEQTPSASGFDGAALPAGISPPDFTLRDQAGARVSLSDYRGRVAIVAFLYSSCGSACVVIAQQIRGALDELPSTVGVLLISADPQTDTAARVRHFLARSSLTGRVRYLTGSRAQLRPVWHAFRIVPASAGQAAFARSASVFLLDRNGQERVIFQLEQLTPEALSHDVRRLLG